MSLNSKRFAATLVLASGLCFSVGCLGEDADGGDRWSLDDEHTSEVEPSTQPGGIDVDTTEVIENDQVLPEVIEPAEPIDLVPLRPRELDEGCDREGLADGIAPSNANKGGEACLQEVYGESGCLSTQLRFYRDGLGRLVREDSAIHELDFQLSACGPYADIPSPYRKEWSYEGDSAQVLEETQSESPEADAPTNRVAYDWSDGALTSKVSEFLDAEGNWYVGVWERWEHGPRGATSWRRGWGEDVGSAEFYARDERGRVLELERQNGEQERYLARRQTWGDGELPLVQEDFNLEGEVTYRLTRSAYEEERAPGEVWEIAMEETWTTGATYYNEVARWIDPDSSLEVTVTSSWGESHRQDERIHFFSKTRQTFDGKESVLERYDEESGWTRYERERYDERGDAIELERWGSAGMLREHLVWERDAAGRVTGEFQDFDQDGAYDLCNHWTYSHEGLLLQETVNVSCDETLEGVQQHTYDTLGRLVQTIADWNGDGVIDQRYEQRFACDL